MSQAFIVNDHHHKYDGQKEGNGGKNEPEKFIFSFGKKYL
jgi:hypothetical protein